MTCDDHDADYDDPEVEEAWCARRRAEVADYLEGQGVEHGRIGEWPAWHVAPAVSVWAIESADEVDRIGWWVICGDLPTDYVGAGNAAEPRQAVRAFADRWSAIAPVLARGEEHPDFILGNSPQRRQELAPMLASRAEVLAGWADRDDLWAENGEDA